MTRTNTIIADLSAGLGALVWWELSDTKITPEDLRLVLAEEGEDASIVPEIDANAAIRRAVREFTKGRGEDRRRAEVVFDEAGRLEVGILRRERVDAHEVKWVQDDVVCYELATVGGVTVVLSCYAVNGVEAAQAFIAHASDYLTHLDATFIRPTLVQSKLNAMGSFRLRSMGGVEYVPSQFMDEVERLGRIVRRIGASSFSVAHVAATASSRTSIEKAARDTMADQLGDLAKRIDAWEELAGKRKIPSHSVTSVLEQFAEIQTRGELYTSALSVTMDDLTARLAVCRVKAMALLESAGIQVDEVAA
jgi:hypothetical protein